MLNEGDGENWFNKHKDDDDQLEDFIMDPYSWATDSKDVLSRLSVIAWESKNIEISIKAVKKLSSELSESAYATKYDHELLVELWVHPDQEIADEAMDCSFNSPPSKRRAFSIRNMLKPEFDDYPDCQILACQILVGLNDSSIAGDLYSLSTDSRKDIDLRETAMAGLCELGDLSYFKRVHDLCLDGDSVATRDDLAKILENFHRSNRKKDAVDNGKVVKWILSNLDGQVISEEICLLALDVIRQLNYFEAKKGQRDELVVLLEKISEKGASSPASSSLAKEIMKKIANIVDEENKAKERKRNHKQTGISETDEERASREELHRREIEAEKDKNRQETGISETDSERKDREEEERVSWEMDMNFIETGIKETNEERSVREKAEKLQEERLAEEKRVADEKAKNLRETGFEETDGERSKRERAEKIEEKILAEKKMIEDEKERNKLETGWAEHNERRRKLSSDAIETLHKILDKLGRATSMEIRRLELRADHPDIACELERNDVDSDSIRFCLDRLCERKTIVKWVGEERLDNLRSKLIEAVSE